MDEGKLLALNERINNLENKLNTMSKSARGTENRIVMIICTQDLDKILPALVIASSAVSLGMKVTFFFTIWGVHAVRKKRIFRNKKATEKLMSLLTPKSFDHLPISNLNLFGIGPRLLKYMIKEHNITSPKDFMKLCMDEGVQFTSCEMTMNILGIKNEELIEGVRPVGVATIINEAADSKFTLFI